MSNVKRDETNVITLLPCPFCGGEADISDEGIGTEPERYWVYCSNPACFVEGTAAYATEAEAIAAWNSRAERTCRMAFGDDMLPECGSCGEPLVYYTRRHGFNSGDKRSACYCPSCGQKVVDA